jgi:hypothetical protein
MRIEAGKYYKTAAGALVWIYSTDPVCGAILDQDGWGFGEHWTADGYYRSPEYPTHRDLVSVVENSELANAARTARARMDYYE